MTSHDRNECDLRREDLHKTFDREPNAPDVAGHVAGCSPCTDALVALQSQRDALQYLSGDPANTDPIGDRTAIEQILSATARTGRGKLADLLYELAKACMIVLPNLKRRVERRVEPREVPAVSSDLGRLVTRIGYSGAGASLVHLQMDVAPPEPRALDVARSCLGVLANVEGESERQQLATSMLLIFEGKPNGAEQVLTRLLVTPEKLQYAELAQTNLMLSFMRQRKYAAAAALGREVLVLRPDDALVLFNTAVSLACLRRRDELNELCEVLSQRIASGSPEWLVRVMRFEAPNFADVLGCSVDEAEQLLGVSAIAGGGAA